MNRKHHPSSFSDSKSGVALVIVLGLLVLITTLAIAFSIYMRTERQAAGNFKNDVAVHFLQRAALNTAIADLDNYFITSNVFHPSWLVYGNASGGMPVTSMFGQAILQYAPAELVKAITNATMQWVPSTLSPKSRCSYLIINCSGLLDPNYIGETNRLWGTNVQEIQLSQLPGATQPFSGTNFAILRNGIYKRFETLPDVKAFATSSIPGYPAPQTPLYTILPPELADYSRFSLTNRVDISGNYSNLISRQPQITAGFMACLPGTLAQRIKPAGILFTNLIDYVDSDYIPGNLGNTNVQGVVNGPYVEATPMINEFMLTNYYFFSSGGGFTNLDVGRFGLNVEFFIPGTTVPSGVFTFNYSLVINNNPANFPTTNLWPATTPVGYLARSNILINFAQPIKYRALTLPPHFVTQIPIPMPLPTSDIRFGVTGRLWVAWNNKIVDEVTGFNLTNVILSTSIALNQPLGGSDGFECVDPRLNWSVGQWSRHSVGSPPSMGKTNNVTLAALNNPALGPQRDSGLDIYLANAPLHVPGELGYLMFDDQRPLETLRLYRHYGSVTPTAGINHPVIDVFTVGGNAPAGVQAQHGKVSIFSHASNVWKAVLGGMPLDFPHGIGANRLQGAQLDAVIDAILATNASFRSVSDLGRVDFKALFPTSTELDRESIIRNTSELLSNRQQYFIIFITAQLIDSQWIAGTGETITSVKGAGSAIAEVWRDPFANPNNQLSNWFVRYFKVLD